VQDLHSDEAVDDQRLVHCLQQSKGKDFNGKAARDSQATYGAGEGNLIYNNQ